MDITQFPIKRKYREDLQLLTPHPSSSTQQCPSSPVCVQHHVLPSVQFARPSINGDWYSIGRSSTCNDLALPSNNRLVSRVHAKLRYLADQHAFEVKCLGFNGIALQISDQSMYIRRATGIMVQINSDECEVGLNIAGSFVELEIPQATDAECHLPVPSSPVAPVYHSDEDFEEEPQDEYSTEHQSAHFIEALSPLTSTACMLTPCATPKTKRIRLTVHPDSSPRNESSSQVSDGARSSPLRDDLPLRPRLLNFEQSVLRVPLVAKEDLCTLSTIGGKENIPPCPGPENNPTTTLPNEFTSQGQAARELELSSRPLSPPAPLIRDAPVPHNFGVPHGPSACKLDSEDVTPVQVQCQTADNVQDHETIAEDDVDAQELELGPDPEFVDMILMTLATSPISPAPIASFVPFFPPQTKLDRIEDFLRGQESVSEVKRSGKDASGRALRSTWFYEPANDSDELRRSRLASLQKPIRATKKSHVQYFWKPVHLKTAVPSNGLIEQKSKRRNKRGKSSKSE